jgi:hypothetical protein
MVHVARFTSYGRCALCGKRTTKAAMTRHLEGCSADHEPSRGRPARLLHLRVEDAYSSPLFWLDVEMKAKATLAELDAFLREIWLECCGHLSAFDIEGTTYNVLPYSGGPPLGDPAERSMNVKLEEVLEVGTRFHHTYDFGTSTELKLRVLGEREGKIGGKPLRILSRNEAPTWNCTLCDEPAEWICTYCMYEQENPFYCEAHAESEEHECGEEALLPVVNSPRMGMCGYTGAAL